MTIRIWTCSVLLTVAPAIALAPVSEALAAAAPSVADREAKAAALFEAGEHAQAIEIFEQLYAERKSPNYLYNIARIQEDAGELEGALGNYDKFVDSPGVELEMRAAAAERAKTIRGILDARRDEEKTPPVVDPPPKENDEGDDEASSTEPPPPRVVTNKDGPTGDQPSRGPGKLGVAGYVLLGTGVVALAAAGIVGGLAVQDEERLKAEGFVPDSRGLQQEGQRKAIAADVLFAVGGTFAAAGLTMVIVDAVRGKKRRANASAPNRRFTFAASGEGVMLGLGGRL